MSIKERRSLEKLKTHQSIIDVAKNIAATEGWQQVTIRKICQEIRYTAPVIYQYFPSKEAILQAIRQEGIREMQTAFEKINSKEKQPEKRLLEYGKAWWKFANKNPELYQVMYNLQGANCQNDNKKVPMSTDVYYKEAFYSINKKAIPSNALSLELCDNIIALIHGFIAMSMVGKIRSGAKQTETVFIHSLNRFIQSIKTI